MSVDNKTRPVFGVIMGRADKQKNLAYIFQATNSDWTDRLQLLREHQNSEDLFDQKDLAKAVDAYLDSLTFVDWDSMEIGEVEHELEILILALELYPSIKPQLDHCGYSGKLKDAWCETFGNLCISE